MKAKKLTGEELSFTCITIIRLIRRDEISMEYLTKYAKNRYFRKKIFNMDAFENIFGVSFWKVKSVLKINMTIRSLLPEIYKVD